MDFKAIVSKVTYKPGFFIDYYFEAEAYGFQLGRPYHRLYLAMDVLDRDDPTIKTRVHSCQAFYADMFKHESDFIYWVRKQIHQLEIHESDEWFKFDGVRKFDPHL